MLKIKSGDKEILPATGSWPETVHVFEEDSIWAVNAALMAQRPLLVRGEPGTGKSQLARAAAHVLGRLFVSEVIHARSECQDLQYHFDAVGRLGQAQVLGATGGNAQNVKDTLSANRYLSPGPLWWVFDWESADKQFEEGTKITRRPDKPENWMPEKGSVFLLDEIDKAEADLPNGLLETLGNGAFPVVHRDKPVKYSINMPPPLVVITTNEERELPAAFVRRCMVLNLELPKGDDELTNILMQRGEAHFGDKCSVKVRNEAAALLLTDRKKATALGIPSPGQAEYLDMLRAVSGMKKEEDEQLDVLNRIKAFALIKHPGMR